MSDAPTKKIPAFSTPNNIKREFPSALSGDMRMPSIDVRSRKMAARLEFFVYQESCDLFRKGLHN